MKENTTIAILIAAALTMVLLTTSEACTRILYETGSKGFIVGRTMDWYDDTGTDLWAFPRGMVRDGGAGAGSIKWTSKYGSVVGDVYDIASADGMNEAGLVGNILYLVESDYGEAKASGKPLLSVGGWLQYMLDNYGTVTEAVEAPVGFGNLLRFRSGLHMKAACRIGQQAAALSWHVAGKAKQQRPG